MRSPPFYLLSLLHYTARSPNLIYLRVAFRGYRSSAVRRQVFGTSSAISLVRFPMLYQLILDNLEPHDTSNCSPSSPRNSLRRNQETGFRTSIVAHIHW